jgi:hypothetical protein
MSDKPTPDDEFDPDVFFERFGEAGLDKGQVDLDRLKELIKLAVAAHPDRDTIVERMKFPSRFYVEAKGDEFELRLVSLESGNSLTLGTLALADVMEKPQG